MKAGLLLACTGILLLTDLGAKDMTQAQLRQAISENRARGCGGYCPYTAPQIRDTKAPSGFKPFYISHLGRHGSRYHSKPEDVCGKVIPALRSLKEDKLLSATGDSLFRELEKLDSLHRGFQQKSYANKGLLTQRGSSEHRGIGERMASRYPSVFRGGMTVDCNSTTSQRAIQSMANFATAVKGRHPGVNVIYRLDMRMSPFPEDKAVSERISEMSASLKEAEKAFIKSRLDHNPELDRFASRIFTDPEEAGRQTGNIYKFLHDIYILAADAVDMDEDVKALEFYTDSELYEFWRAWNVHQTAYVCYDKWTGMRILQARTHARRIVLDADKALQGNGHCADLRFAHDGEIGPLLALVAPEGCDKPVSGDIELHFQGWRYVGMGCNLQFIFYRNSRAEVLVKVLRNEEETTIPALKSASGPYYRWSDFREYILRRAGCSGED